MVSVEPQHRARRKLLAETRRFQRRCSALPCTPGAFYFTDPCRTPDPARIVASLPPGWGVVYRHFGEPHRVEIAKRLAAIARRRRLVLLIGSDPQLAAMAGADGVHWAASRLPRRSAPHVGWLATAAAHSRREIGRACRWGAGAIFLSPAFASLSPSAGPPLGVHRLARLASTARGRPVLGLGGVSDQTIGTCSALPGLAGWAAIGSIEAAFGGGAGTERP